MSEYKGHKTHWTKPSSGMVIGTSSTNNRCWWSVQDANDVDCWIDLSDYTTFIRPTMSVTRWNKQYPYIAFGDNRCMTVVAFKSEEEFHMALLTYPEI